MQPIKLDLTLEQTDLILDALGRLPYVQVFQLIDTVCRQAQSQIQQPRPAGTEPAQDPARRDGASTPDGASIEPARLSIARSA